ncbi:hypothetical protein A9G42_07475 [Gilliamella sp. Nev6-6]|uniref:hypothetical protein n=1 Tax=Gilliamella sp. Nev6-6 TaxID=3120252 RepID=UPI00080F59E9|nr:hypothetical protein [Gilliamella apicola]OCG76624.1 hypothetical protein A9G42_07475 [Gilliamella apicola]
MNIFSRLFGKKSKLQQADEALIENPNIQAPLALSIVFKGQFYLDQDNLLKQLRSIDSSMKNIRCQMPYGKLRLFNILCHFGKLCNKKGNDPCPKNLILKKH